jgi:ATP-dependent exoDNAse (exonuclease V) beta subunit
MTTSSTPFGNIRIISASAGSGKTTRLAAELERAIVEEGVAPDRILATTFTKKAAAELVERGRRVLLRRGDTEVADRFRAARIGTVNAVAGRIVSDFAFDCGMSPELVVFDEQRARDTFRQCLQEVVTREDLDVIADLSSRFATFPWAELVGETVARARTNGLGAVDLSQSASRSHSELFSLLPGQALDLDDILRGETEAAATALKEQRAKGDATKATEAALDRVERARSRLKRGRTLSWQEWTQLGALAPAKKSAAAVASLVHVATRMLEHPRFHADLSAAIALVFSLAQRALTTYQRHKARVHAIDFIDQEGLALELVQRPDIRALLQSEIELVLVDEFQDTSPLQLALFLELSRIAPRSIWVGDPKQAIYGFRGADPALMAQAVGALLGGTVPEALRRSYRSRAPLVALTNQLFVPAFAADGLPAVLVELEPASDADDPTLGPIVERWRLSTRNREQDAAAVARCTLELLADATLQVRGEDGPRRVRPGDVAILCMTRNMCALIARCLASLGVPNVVARAGLLQTEEGQLLYAAVRLWGDPLDALASAELARMLVYPTDASTFLDEALKARELDAPAFSTETPVRAVLDARKAQPHAGPLDAFDAICRALGIDDLCAQLGRSSARLANVDAFRSHIVRFVEECAHTSRSRTVGTLASWLQALAVDEGDTQAPPADDDAVTVTTWHGSKGLEWPIVVLAESDRERQPAVLGVNVVRDDDVAFSLAKPLGGRFVRYWPNPFSEATRLTPFHALLAQHPATAQAEHEGDRQRLRLLYVGWTRARDRVVLAGRSALPGGLYGFFAGAGFDEPKLNHVLGTETQEHLGRARWGGIDLDVVLRGADGTVGVLRRRPLPVEVEDLQHEPMAWPPATHAPSSATGVGVVANEVVIGAPMPAVVVTEPDAFGVAVHAWFGAEAPDDDDDAVEMAAGLVRGFEGAGVSAADIVACRRRLEAALALRWPHATARREVPFSFVDDAGTTTRGAIDLLLDTPDGFVVVDHKVLLGDVARARTVAAAYSGQLQAYADAVARLSARPVLSTWIHLPLQGLLLEVRSAS